MKYLICLILIHITYTFQGQELSIHGSVIDTSGVGVKDIHIINVTQGIGTTSNTTGHFEILVNLWDTLEISSVQYTRVYKIINKIDLVEPLQIILNESIETLADIVLVPKKTILDTLPKEVGDINLNLPFKNNLIKRPYLERQYDVLKPKVKYYGIGVSASFLGSFTKEYKEIKKVRAIKVKDDSFGMLYTSFDEDFYIEKLNIPNQKLGMFIEFCIKNDPSIINLVRENELYTLIERLKKQSILFLTNVKE